MSAPRKTKLLITLLVVVIVLVAASSYAFKATSTTEFCVSCHEMGIYERELKFSSHAKDKDGIPITCSQCHLPASMGPKYLAMKTYLGVKDLYVHVTDAPESLDRAAKQVTARRFIDDSSCLSCHEDLYKDGKGEKPITELGRIAHDAYLRKNGETRSNNCTGCHINLAHLPRFDQRIPVNAEFKSRLLKEEAPVQ